MMGAPAVSVLMPVYNGCSEETEPFLRQAIDGILYQTFEDFEFLIVDDGSTDDTPTVLQEYADQDPRIRIVRQEPNQGIVAALNLGLQECAAPLIARQDADDISTVTRLELQTEFLAGRTDTALCGTGMYVIDGHGRLKTTINDRPCDYPTIRQALCDWGCVFVHGSVMFRRDAAIALGGYSDKERYHRAEDYEFWVRFASKYVVENIPGAVYYFHRDHSSKISQQFRDEQEAATERIKELAYLLLQTDQCAANSNGE